jgi:hypothetical protein
MNRREFRQLHVGDIVHQRNAYQRYVVGNVFEFTGADGARAIGVVLVATRIAEESDADGWEKVQ